MENLATYRVHFKDGYTKLDAWGHSAHPVGEGFEHAFDSPCAERFRARDNVTRVEVDRGGDWQQVWPNGTT
jgi:hypothetical protein